MSLVKIAFPKNASDLAMVVCLLEGNTIPYYVHNAGFGGLYPGPQIQYYNNITVMVPASAAEEAMEVLSVLSEPQPVEDEKAIGAIDRIRMVLETLLAGWFVPGRSHKNKQESANH